MRTLNLTDTNTFYAPASDECWILLAKEIMNSYALTYSCQLPTNARTQDEYDLLNRQKFAPQRRSILRKIKHGPLRNAIDIYSVYYGLEQLRLDNKNFWRIPWEDNYEEDLENL